MDIKEQLIKHEGLRLDIYEDSVGKMTIGVGRNIEDKGITRDEAMTMLDNDIREVEDQVNHFRWFDTLSEVRRRVVIDMVFNLGINRFKGFKKTIAHIAAGDYEGASKEMLDSKWSKQVGVRAETLSRMMRDNID